VGLLALTFAGPAAAQLTDSGTPTRPPGWSVTPAIGVSELWDDNPRLAVRGDVRPGDFVTSVRPSFMLGYRGRHTTLRSDYNGSFDFYRELREQNTRDHRAGLDFTHQLTPRVQLFARDQAMVSPTTGDLTELGEAVQVGATPLRRQTTRMNAFRGGVDATLGRRTTLNAAYASQWIDFAEDADAAVTPLRPDANLLRGGHSHGAVGELRHRVSPRVAFGGDYTMQRAIVGGGAETFDVQSALGALEFGLSPSVRASVAYGHAWLTAGRDGFSDNGPAFNASLDWQGRRLSGTLGYGRSFLPSFGFGGTFQNEELRASLRATLSRYVTWTGGLAVSDNDPLEAGDPTLRAVSAQTAVGWLVKRRLRLEVFALHVSQDSGRAGGRVLRTRAGVQATVFDTMRASR
jgi:hypothetical protein